MLLDEVMPVYDVASRQAIRIAADPKRVYQVTRQADLGRPWIVRALMGLRIAPARIGAALRARRPDCDSAPDPWSVGPVGFTLVAEEPEKEMVLGLMGRFWTLTGGLVSAEADAFRRPPPAGLALGIWNFRVEPAAGGTELSTETRVRCADSATRRQFLRYWRVIRPGSVLIRRSVLRDIRRTAER